MKKCCIIIETSQGKLVKNVPNFSKENILTVLSKVIKVDINNIEQVSASASYGIYGIKEIYPSARELHTQSVRFMSNEYDTYFVVDYGYLVD